MGCFVSKRAVGDFRKEKRDGVGGKYSNALTKGGEYYLTLVGRLGL